MESGKKVTTFVDNKGRTIQVTTLALSDLNDLLVYANNLIAEDTFVLLSGKPLTKAYERTYVKNAIQLMEKNQKLHYIARCGTQFVGSFEVRRFTLRKSHVGELGISLAPTFRDGGIGKQCVQLVIDQAKKLGLRLLVLTCFASNTRAIHLYESLGFTKVGITPEAFLYKGNYEDELHMYRLLT